MLSWLADLSGALNGVDGNQSFLNDSLVRALRGHVRHLYQLSRRSQNRVLIELLFGRGNFWSEGWLDDGRQVACLI
jgi:hypothetical protein